MNFNLSTLDLSVFALYIFGVLALGLYAAKKRLKTKRDYFLAGDKLPWWMIGGSIMAANISSHQLVGTMGVAYSRGFVAIITEWGAILLGFNALLWIFLPFYLRNGFYTMPEFLQKRFGGGARTTYSILVLFTYIFVEIGAVLYLGALSLHSLLEIPMEYSVLALAGATGIYTILGGLRAVIWTEMLQLGVLMLGMAALSFTTIEAAGGISAV
ncbi:MAG: sodium:solute symporter family transporter, partial [Adhaeribacter sp.]